MKTFIFTLAICAGLIRAAHAETCYTNCYGSGNNQTCTTQCYGY